MTENTKTAMGHAPEPWEIVFGEKHGYDISHSCSGDVAQGLTENDAKRIVACVNLLAGIPTSLLEDPVTFAWVQAMFQSGRISAMHCNCGKTYAPYPSSRKCPNCGR